MAEAAISQMWEYINEVLELQCGKFSLKQLTSRKWYLQTMSVLFPFLSQEWQKIATQIQSEEAAIDRILLLLTQEGAIPEQYLAEIKGHSIVRGDQQTIMTLIQIVYQLVEQALEEGQDPEEGHYAQNQQENEEQDTGEAQEDGSNDRSQEKSKQLPVIRPQSPMTIARAESQPDRDKDPHSVLGIGNEFEEEPSESQDHHYNIQRTIPESKPGQTFKNPYLQMAPGKAFPMKATNYKQEQQDDNYLGQKNLNKYKSQPQLKNLPKQKAKPKKPKKQKVLVAHPTMPKQYPKANTTAQKKLTRDVKTVISGSRKALEKENNFIGSPTAKDQIDRKKRELQYFASASKQNFNKKSHATEIDANTDKNASKLKKLLKWKQANLKRQQKQLQLNLEMKVQLKKQAYIKKINKLILNLQKQKMLDLKRQEKERQRREKELADKRLVAIEQQYKDQMELINTRASNTKKLPVHTDHRSIVEGLERELKRQNQKQINALKTRLRREEAQLDDDLEALQKEIIRAYKRN